MNGMKCVVREAIMEISRVYNFDGEEACRMLELVKPVSKVNSVNSVNSVAKVKPVKAVKSSFPLPFNGIQDMSCCQSLRQNHGLYTQCQSGRMNGGEFCKSCQTQCDKNGGLDYGTIGDRMKAHEEGVEFKDPSGKSPTAYSIVMKKLKLTREQVEEEAGKLNIIIAPNHFEEVATKKSGRPAKADKPEKTESKQKGRPKKSKKVLELAGEEEDLFASLVMSANKTSKEEMSQDEEDGKTVIMSDSEDDKTVEEVVTSNAEPNFEQPLEKEKPVEKAKKKVISEAERLEKEAEKEAKKQALEAEKEAKKQALEAEKEAKKQALEAEKEAKKQALEAEKEAKKKAAEEEKELAKQKKLALEAEKEAKKQALEAEKEAKKQALEAEKAKKELAKQQKELEKQKKPKEEAKPAAQVEDEEEADVVNKIEFEGKKYLRSKKTGIIYNMEQDVVGKWNAEKNRVDFNVEEEESEEEYEDDDNN
jgi:hypothetical protein